MVADGRAGSRAKLSRGTAAARRTRKIVPHERGRGTAPEKTVVHRPILVCGQVMVMVMVMVVRYHIQIPRFARE